MTHQTPGAFGFEKLDSYQRSIEFIAAAHEIISELPAGHSSLSDQLRRAALSVAVNIAEGPDERALPIAAATTRSREVRRRNAPQS